MSAERLQTMAPLQAIGFVRFNLAEELEGIDLEPDLAELRRAFSDLPPDPYAPNLNRYRRYSRAVLTPGRRMLAWIPHVTSEDGTPVSEYYQGGYNPEFPQAKRQFPALSDRLEANSLLQRIIWFDREQTFWNEHDSMLPLHVGVHFIKLMVDHDDQQAISSPNELHQDGEPFTFAHLVVRRNVVGGLNTIAKPSCSGLLPQDISDRLILAQFELTGPLDSYGVCDAKISHYVSPVTRGPAAEPAERGVILVDFTPMEPRI